MRNPSTRLGCAVLGLAGLLAVPAVHAEQRPLWEIGAGATLLALPDYRGSDQRDNYLLPLPYFTYRGKILKADRNGVRGLLFESERVQLNLSLNATLPVSNEDNPARSGMPSLKPSVEFGPILNMNLWRSADHKTRLNLRAPLRSAFTLEASPRQIGWLFSPGLNLEVRDPAGYGGWNFGLLASALVHSRRNNAYFYSVAPGEATAARPAYDAPGGYAGAQFTLTLSKRFPRYWVGGFLRYDTVAGAVFADSPLVKQHDTVWAGVAIAWIFAESATRVAADD
jgi:outer membrane scaffolding protein for murein synthesis (MipA/OmpV family)